MRMRCGIALAALFATTAPCQSPPVSARQFAEKAFAALPVEEPYAFRRLIEAERDRPRRDPAARPRADEVAIADSGWSLILAAGAGPVLRTAAEEFRAHLEKAYGTSLKLAFRESLAGWENFSDAVVAGTRDQMPGCGPALAGRKAYRLSAGASRIAACGFDERGAMYALYNLEARFGLREAPFIPRNLDQTRRSLYGARMILSGLGWMQWPDWYLRLLPRYGFDSIYASVYANPDGTPAGAVYQEMMRRQDPARMRDLMKRAARFGLDVYCPIMFHLDDEPGNEARLRQLVRKMVTEFPEIRGYVLLIEGFDYDGWPGWTRTDIREWIRKWTRGVAVAAEEMHKINPRIEVLPWDYNIDFRPQATELKRFVIDQYPADVMPLLTWENGKGFERDGEQGYLKDYAINEVGPAEVTAAQMDRIKQRGLPGFFLKADTFASWQYGTFPYLPFPHQWDARHRALDASGVYGTMETWSYGFKPNFMAEVRAWTAWSGAPPLEELLGAIGQRDFGSGNEKLAIEAWDRFSRAIRLVPDTGPNMGTTNAIGSAFFFEKPMYPRAMTVENSWEDQAKWRARASINPIWPYAPERVIVRPDFTNQVNVAERYAQPFSLKVFWKYLLLAADEMEQGLAAYRRAALQAPRRKQLGAMREVLLAEQLQHMMRSDQAILEFEDLRFRLAKESSKETQTAMLRRMTELLTSERERTRLALETTRRDSRLGYEWEQDYFYTPYVLGEKLRMIDGTLATEIPRYRRSHGLP